MSRSKAARVARPEVAEIREGFEKLHAAEVAKRPLKAKAVGGPLRTLVAVGKDGKPTKRVLHSKLLEKLFEKENLRLAAEGRRPAYAKCVELTCGEWFGLPRSRTMPVRCPECRLVRKRELSRARDRKRRAARPETSSKWHKDNPEKARESWRKWRESNRERVREGKRKRHAANPEKAREYSRRWRAAKKAVAKERS